MLSGNRTLKILFLFTLIAIGSTHRAEAAMFRILGLRGGGLMTYSSTRVMDVSDDGTTAVGSYTYGPEVGPPQTHLRRWDANGELLPTADLDAGALAVSADGSVLVGRHFSWDPDGSFLGYDAILVWRDDLVINLEHLPGGSHSSPSGISADGSVVVGQSKSESGSGPHAVRWSRQPTLDVVELLPLPGETTSSATAISADGRFVVGLSMFDLSNSNGQAVRWTADGTVIGLGRLGDHPSSYAADVSGDGSAIVGWSGVGMPTGPLPTSGTPGDEAFLWTEADGMIGLGFLPGYGWSEATAISADGSVVVGSSAALIDNGEFTSVGQHEAFIWDAEHGMRNLKDLLADQYGLEMPDWSLGTPTGISADGRVIVGNGGSGLAGGGAWMVTIPEPSTFALMATGLLGWAGLVRGKRKFRRSVGQAIA